MKKILVIIMALMLLLSFTGCSANGKESGMLDWIASDIQPQPTLSYEEMIEEFVPNWDNCQTLKIGDIHKAKGYLWLPNGGTVYSSDASVVTVGKLGKVTAVGEGVAYVIITSGTLHKVTRYTVKTG